MVKQCNFEGCSEEIPSWGTYCARHYQMMMTQQQQEPPKVPQPRVAPKPQQEEPKEAPKFNISRMEERERLIVKQTCLKCAVEIMTNTEFENQSFEEMIDRIGTLVVRLFNLVVEHNES